MSAARLREAATLMRLEFPDKCDCAGSLIETTAHEASCASYLFEWPRSVATWLDACAQFVEDSPEYTHEGEDYALAVADAYLGSTGGGGGMDAERGEG